MQVFDLGQFRPDQVLEKVWANFEKDGDAAALAYRGRMRIIAAGGDGTVAWVLQVRPAADRGFSCAAGARVPRSPACHCRRGRQH